MGRTPDISLIRDMVRDMDRDRVRDRIRERISVRDRPGFFYLPIMQYLQQTEDYLHGSVLHCHWRVLNVTGARAGLCDLQMAEADACAHVRVRVG